jgi:hypothetical protein
MHSPNMRQALDTLENLIARGVPLSDACDYAARANRVEFDALHAVYTSAAFTSLNVTVLPAPEVLRAQSYARHAARVVREYQARRAAIDADPELLALGDWQLPGGQA